jgi:hypothetical protein
MNGKNTYFVAQQEKEYSQHFIDLLFTIIFQKKLMSLSITNSSKKLNNVRFRDILR